MSTLLTALLITFAAVPAPSYRSPQEHGCPGGAAFGFLPNSNRLNRVTKDLLDNYLANWNAPPWDRGWVTVVTLIKSGEDPELKLTARRRATIRAALIKRGFEARRLRFESEWTDSSSEEWKRDWKDLYITVLSTPQDYFETVVSPGVDC